LSANLKIGDQIVISGHDREFVQVVDSMQVEHEQVAQAKPGDSVGLKVGQEVKAGDQVSLMV
jgi:translation elongation factor EF-1alpha